MIQRRLFAAFVATLGYLVISASAQAQLNGVLVDAQGVLQLRTYQDPGGRLHRQRVAAARAALDQNILRRNDLRKVSLNRLERALRESLADNRQPTDAMRNLAGLTRVRYVFYYPETQDVVLAGPAEGWCRDVAGHVVGINSGRPTLELQDLIVAIRAYGPEAAVDPVVSVSIDPTPEGLSRMQEFLSNLRGIKPSDAPRIVQGLRTSMGMQDIAVNGVSPNTHFAQVLIEADYRMKLIGIGLEPPPVKMTTFVARATPTSNSALQRWYFVPDYECVRVTEDDLAMQLVGDGVRLLSEDQVVQADGSRRISGRASRASHLFTQSFTKNYARMAARSTIWAQMRNVIDLAVAAAYIREQGFYEKSGWQPKTFLDESAYAVETYTPPQKVETVVNSIWRGNILMTPVGGGVRVQATQALASGNLLEDTKHEVKKAREAIDPSGIAHDRWWWD